MTLNRTSLLVVLALVIAACGGGESSTEEAPAENSGEESMEGMSDSEMEGMEQGEEISFGSPADASEADRTVEVQATDELTFDPATVAVQQGETIRFVVRNDGNLPHDFVIGDEAAQQAHEEEMEGMDHANEPNVVSVPSGETAELTWTFDGAVEGVLYGCHEPGHYEAGMVGAFSLPS